MHDPMSERFLRDYLLGIVREEQKETIEQAVLTNESENERLLIIEEELMEDYLEGNLTQTEQESFENYFLIPRERRQHLASVRALRDLAWTRSVARPIDQSPSGLMWFRKPRLMIPSMAALVIVFSIASAVLYAWNRQLRAELVRQQGQVLQHSQQAHLHSDEPPKLTASAPILLHPGLVRGLGEILRIQVPAGAEAVNFGLPVSAQDYTSYAVVLRSPEGEDLWSEAQLTGIEQPTEVIVYVSVPTSLLQPGDYQLFLSGIRPDRVREPLTSYSFSISTR